MTAPDPLDALRQPLAPIAPRPEFARALRRTIQAALGHDRGGGEPLVVAPAVTNTRSYTPERLHSITPYLCVRDATRAIEWYTEVFGATEVTAPIIMDDGRVGHAELQIGDSVIMVADEHDPEGVRSPLRLGGTSVQLMIHVPDSDAVFERAVEAGAHVWRPVEVQHGARTGKIRDPFGHNWFIATDVEAAEAAEAAPIPAGTSEVGYFTMGTPDEDRARAFYGAVLGWEFVPGYVEHGYQITNVTPMGGLWGGADRPGVTLLFHVDDVDAAVARVRELGGQAEEPQDRPYGRSASCRDDQGLRFDLLTPPH